MGAFIDLKNQTFGDWKALRYLGNSLWECENSLGEIKNIHSYTLRTKLSNNTQLGTKPPDGILGNTFGEWEPQRYIGGGFWECRCSCGSIGKVNTHDLKNGLSTKCRKCANEGLRKDGLKPGDVINEWTLLHYIGNQKWKCRCSCGIEKEVSSKYLVDKSSKSCGHDRNYHIIKKDITGQHFGSLVVLRYSGKDNMWTCQCENCGTIKDIHRDSLVSGKTRSCGCLKESIRAQTLLERYGDTNTTRVNNPREEWQIRVISDREEFEKFIDTLGHKPTVTELSERLDVNDTTILKALKKFEIADIVKHSSGVSDIELSILDWIKSLGVEVQQGNREALNGQELDMYIPSKKIAIEFNGSYWHSTVYKGANYHQNKTIQCIKQGIHLIHIFEYEWKDEKQREKIKDYIRLLVLGPQHRVYARNTTIKYIEVEKTKEFLDNYHLQGNGQSSIRLGCFNKEDGSLIGVMTFGKPRFNSNSEYEIIRLCWKAGYSVIGGTEKLFSRFIKDYAPESIVTYSDISKFTGNIYTQIGFKTSLKDITKPGYVWVNIHSSNVLSRYQTMKHKLISEGLGRFGNTEDEIMESLGYIKIHDSGNLRLKWSRN